MRSIEKRAIESFKVPITALMEAAGLNVADAVIELLEDLPEPKVALLCGKGNNGGDGLVAAKYLTAERIDNDVFIFGAKNSLRGDTLANLKILQKSQPDTIKFVSDAKDIDLSSYDLIVDAILGTGTKGDLREPINSVVEHLSTLSAMVVAVDMPTGISAEDGNKSKNAVKADITITMGIPKIGQFFNAGMEHCGEIRVAPIGFPAAAISEGKVDIFMLENRDVRKLLPPLAADLYKQQAGKLMAIGGSKGMTGAITLSSKAALSMGCGLVITAVPASLNEIFEVKLTEEMTLPLEDDSKGHFTAESSSALTDYYEWADVLLIGPGLGKTPETAEFVLKVAEGTRIPMVIDADALAVFKERRSLLAHLGSSTVLTPHHAEFANTFEYPIEMVKKNPISVARETAVKYGINIVLKGAPSVTADPDGTVYLNPTGNPGMATAGSGDVLTGMIGSLIAQGLSSKDAAVAGVYLHGLAGDIAADEMGMRPMKASDLIRSFPEMYRAIE